MIRVLRPAVSMSVQDLGRHGQGDQGFCRSGAMDPASLRAVNRIAGAPADSAVIELGPGPCVFEATEDGRIAMGGALRDGAPWWTPINLRQGDKFELSSPKKGVWSYLALAGGVAARSFLGSRSTCAREGVGDWIRKGDRFTSESSILQPADVDPPPLSGPIRVFGVLPSFRIGRRMDRMGYELVVAIAPGKAEALSEPTLPGFVQALPSGKAFALMAEAPTLGGYPVIAVVHPDDLRLLAQARPGQRVHVTQIPAD